MTAPDKIWINWNPSEGMRGRVSVEAITVLAYIDTMPYPTEYTRTVTIPTDARLVTSEDEIARLRTALTASLAREAVAFEAAAKECDVFIAYLKAGEASSNDNLGRTIRALTPADAQAALDRMIAEARADDTARLLAAAGQEYVMSHDLEVRNDRMGRRSAIRGMMVRMGLYAELDGAIDAANAKIGGAL